MVQPGRRPSDTDAAARDSRREADNPRHARPGFPNEPDRAGGQSAAMDRHPRGGPAYPSQVAADPSATRSGVGETPEDARSHLFQRRKRQPSRQPQAQYRRPPGLVQQAIRDQAPYHGDRGRPVGMRPGVRLHASRPRVQGFHGPNQFRPEAAPETDDEGLGGRLRGQPEHGNQRRAADPRDLPGYPGKPRHSHQRGCRGGCRATDPARRDIPSAAC